LTLGATVVRRLGATFQQFHCEALLTDAESGDKLRHQVEIQILFRRVKVQVFLAPVSAA
jgi:hypothetical protein